MHAVAGILKPVLVIERDERGEEYRRAARAAGRANCEQKSVAQQKARSTPMSGRPEGMFTPASQSRTGVVAHPCTTKAVLSSTDVGTCFRRC